MYKDCELGNKCGIQKKNSESTDLIEPEVTILCSPPQVVIPQVTHAATWVITTQPRHCDLQTEMHVVNIAYLYGKYYNNSSSTLNRNYLFYMNYCFQVTTMQSIMLK